MRKSPIVSPGSVEDMESSVLPMRGIKEGKRELGKILFLLPLIQPQSSAHFPRSLFPPPPLFLMLSPSFRWGVLLFSVLTSPWL